MNGAAPSFAERVGGVLVAPRPTLARLAGGGARVGDVALLLLGWMVASLLPELVHAVLEGRAEGLDAGLLGLFQTFAHLQRDVLGILVAGVIMALFVPKGARGHGHTADLAAYAWIPYLTVQLGGSLVYSALGRLPGPRGERWATGLGLGWSVAVWALALDAARVPKPAPPLPSAPPPAPAEAA